MDSRGFFRLVDEARLLAANARALFARALLFAGRGERTRALADAKEAARHGSSDADAWLAAASRPKRVRHKKFGDGIVVGVEETAEGQKLEIDFSSGKKKLLASFVDVID